MGKHPILPTDLNESHEVANESFKQMCLMSESVPSLEDEHIELQSTCSTQPLLVDSQPSQKNNIFRLLMISIISFIIITITISLILWWVLMERNNVDSTKQITTIGWNEADSFTTDYKHQEFQTTVKAKLQTDSVVPSILGSTPEATIITTEFGLTTETSEYSSVNINFNGTNQMFSRINRSKLLNKSQFFINDYLTMNKNYCLSSHIKGLEEIRGQSDRELILICLEVSYQKFSGISDVVSFIVEKNENSRTFLDYEAIKLDTTLEFSLVQEYFSVGDNAFLLHSIFDTERFNVLFTAISTEPKMEESTGVTFRIMGFSDIEISFD